MGSTLEAGLWDYNLMTHGDITWTERNEEFLYKWVGENVAKRHPSLFFHVSSPVKNQEAKWSFAFQSRERLDPQSAKALLLKVHKDLVQEIQRNREAVCFLSQDMDLSILPKSYIALKITFFNKNSTIVPPPHVARIFMNCGNIYYNIYNPELDEFGETIAL